MRATGINGTALICRGHTRASDRLQKTAVSLVRSWRFSDKRQCNLYGDG